jgi:hypothetical protein
MKLLPKHIIPFAVLLVSCGPPRADAPGAPLEPAGEE